MEGIPPYFQLIAAAFFLIIGVVNVALMWFRGRFQRREDPTYIGVHKRILAWWFIGMTLPFLILFLGAEATGLNVFENMLAKEFNHPVFIATVVFTICLELGLIFYVFGRGGAAELVRLQPVIRVQPASLNKEICWKILVALIIPFQCIVFYYGFLNFASFFP